MRKLVTVRKIDSIKKVDDYEVLVIDGVEVAEYHSPCDLFHAGEYCVFVESGVALPAKVGRPCTPVAGILILLGGALGVTQGLLALLPETGADILSSYESIIPQGEVLDSVMNEYQLLSGAIVIFGLLAVVMSMFAFTRTRFAGAVAGGAFGVLSVGFLFGAFSEIVGLILLVSSKREFIPECD